MTVRIEKSGFNLREKLTELDVPVGAHGSQVMQSESLKETFNITKGGRRNLLVNGSFSVWQRGNTFTSGYTADLGVKQLEKDASDEGSVLRTYNLKYSFPTNVSQIDVAYDSNDQIEEFTVEFQYSYFTAEAGSGARAGVSALPVV